MSKEKTPLVRFQGVIQDVRYRNDADGFSILVVRTDEGMVSVKGHTTAGANDRIEVEGAWVRHPKHGPQVEAAAIISMLPEGLKNIERFLGNGLIKGLGPRQAAKVVAAFGDETFDVLDNAPHKLANVPGLGAKTIEKIQISWREHRASAHVLAALAGHDVGPGTALRIYKQYGADALDIIRTDPYRLAREIRGIGFRQADSIGRAAGIAVDAPSRIAAGVLHVVREAVGRGSTGVERRKLLSSARQLLEVSEMAVQPVLERLSANSGPLAPGLHATYGPVLFDRELFDAEHRIASTLRALTENPLTPRSSERVSELLDRAERTCNVELAPEQRQAVLMALSNRVSVLTGGPGTGKTATLKTVLAALKEDKRQVVLGAPTGKAAKRMQQSTGNAAATLARLVGQGSAQQADRTIEADVLIIDEASMVDVPLLDRTLVALRPDASILFVGDVDQLPSVGAGRVLGDLIDCAAVPVTRLTQVFRQAAESAIVRNAHRINRGEALETGAGGRKDFVFVASTDPEDIVNRVAAIVRERIPGTLGIAASDIQVLSPMRKGATGVTALNAVLQQALNPEPPDAIARGSTRFAVGDRVVQTVNNYGVGMMNGESAVIRGIDRENTCLKLDVEGKAIDYPLDDIDQLDLAYAMTIHKSQGSQFPAVVVPICTQHFALLQRGILYTAVTRATQFCVVVGDPKAVAMAIANSRSEPRVTALADVLRDEDARLDQLLSSRRSPIPIGSTPPF